MTATSLSLSSAPAIQVGDRVYYEDSRELVVRSFSRDGKVAYLAVSMRATRTLAAAIANLRLAK